jgi:hypothetical protein
VFAITTIGGAGAGAAPLAHPGNPGERLRGNDLTVRDTPHAEALRSCVPLRREVVAYEALAAVSA